LRLGPDISNGKLTPEIANEKYGMGGQLKFDKPVSDTYARGMMELKSRELRNQEKLNKGPQNIVAKTAQFGAGIAASTLDPINIGVSLIPGGPLLKGMGLAKLAASKTAGATVAKGAMGGVAGALAVEPLPYFSAQKYQLDYDLTDSLLNVTFGGVLGAGFAGIGLAAGKFKEAGSIDGLLKSMSHEKQTKIMGESVVKAIDDKMPNIAADLIEDVKLKLKADYLTDEQFLKMIPEEFEGVYARAVSIKERLSQAVPEAGKKQQGLVDFIIKRGGINDESGEIRRGMGIKPKERPGLITNKKKTKVAGGADIDNTPDYLLSAAQEAGLIKKDADINDLYDALDLELRGMKKTTQEGFIERDPLKDFEKDREGLYREGFDENMSVGEIFDNLMAQQFEARRGIETDVDNELFDNRLTQDTPYSQEDLDMFLSQDQDFDIEIKPTKIEQQLADIDFEFKNHFENLSDADKATYQKVMDEIDEEVLTFNSLKEDASNLAACMLGA
jgi:hypothetical protein